MRCVVDHEGKWLCGPPDKVPLTSAAPLTQLKEEVVVQPAAAPLSVPVEPIQKSAPAQSKPAAIAQPTATPAHQPEQTPVKEKTVQATATKPVATKVHKVTTDASCPIPASGKQAPIALVNREGASLSIDATDMEIHGKSLFIYKGKVVMERADQSLHADQATYNHDLGLFEAEGNLHYKETGTELQGDRAKLNTQTDSGTIDNAHYRILATGASGDAEQIEMVSRYVNRYHGSTYTTCNPNEKSWELSAEQVELDELEGWGSAKNAVVSFKGVPILYSPAYTFPLDERRKSGILFPSWGYDDVGGGDFSVPYYWNIAPNQDAVITPRSIGRRGLMLSGNFRYLNSNSHGEIDASMLPSDDLAGDDRYQFKLKHQGTLETTRLDNPLDYNINFATLSDKQYLSDFGNSLGLSSSDTLEQTANLSYSQDRLKVSAELTSHYTVSSIADTSKPYRKLPQIDASWSSESGNNQLNYSVEGQFVHFEHSASSKPNAERYWVKPSVNYNHTMLNDALFIKPALSVSQSHYDLDTGSSSSMTVPHYTLETGLFLEREATDTFALLGGADGYLQTLEPSLKFSYIPDGKDSGQSFDDPTESGNSSIDLSEFHGKDSAPHTKQVTWTINNSWTRETDNQKIITASLEQSRDFKSTRTRNWSNLVAKMNTDFGPHDTRIELNWDPYDNWNDTIIAGYQFNDDNGKIFNIDYNFKQNDSGVDEKKQLDLSAAWELNSQWNLFARYNQELNDSNSRNYRLEDLIGVSYDSCCWSANFTRRKYLTGSITSTEPYDTIWYLVLELKGLGKLGRKSSSLGEQLEQSIKGYKSEP